MGAGDVKLMAAVGAWLSWPASLAGTLLSLIAGGVFALAVAGGTAGGILFGKDALEIVKPRETVGTGKQRIEPAPGQYRLDVIALADVRMIVEDQGDGGQW